MLCSVYKKVFITLLYNVVKILSVIISPITGCDRTGFGNYFLTFAPLQEKMFLNICIYVIQFFNVMSTRKWKRCETDY